MKVLAVILTHNSAQYIEKCLDSVKNTKKVDEIVVIDSASNDGTIQLVKKKYKAVKVIELAHNVGFAVGNNIGINQALGMGADYVLILNPDTILDKNCIKELLMHGEAHVQPRILGPKIYMNSVKNSHSELVEESFSSDFVNRDPSTQPLASVGMTKKGKIIWSVGGELDEKRYTAKLIGYEKEDDSQFHDVKVEFVSGTCMLIPKQVLETGLRFYEPYFMYYEDVEFCVQAKKIGFPSYVVTGATIVHLETSASLFTSPRPSPSKGEGGRMKDYYLARNHLLFVERNGSSAVKLRELMRLPKTVYEHASRTESLALKGIQDYMLRKFGK